MSVHQQLVWWKHSRTETQAQLPAVCGGGSGWWEQWRPTSEPAPLRPAPGSEGGRAAEQWEKLHRRSELARAHPPGLHELGPVGGGGGQQAHGVELAEGQAEPHQVGQQPRQLLQDRLLPAQLLEHWGQGVKV